MKKLWSIVTLMGCLLLGSTISLRAQNIDSLKKVLLVQKNDSDRCEILSLMISDTPSSNDNSNIDRLIELATKNIEKHKNNKVALKTYKYYYALGLSNKGFVNQQESSFDKAIQNFTQSLSIFKEIGNKENIALELNNIGYAYSKIEDPRAIEFYTKAIELQKKINDQTGLANTVNNIGNLFENRGDIAKALDFYNQGLNISEQNNDKAGLSQSLHNLANIYEAQGEVEKALEYYHKGYELSKSINDKVGMANELNSIASVFDDRGDFDKALENYLKSLNMYQELGDRLGQGALLNNIGYLYLMNDQNDKAEEYFIKSHKLHTEISSKQGIANSLCNIATIYYRNKQYEKAINNLTEAFQISKAIGNIDLIHSASNGLSTVYKSTQNYKLALEYFEISIQMLDSINNIETQKATIKQQTQYEYDKKKALADKEHELQLKQQEEKSAAEKTKQNIIIASVSVVLLLVAVFSVFLYNRFKVTQRQKAIIEVKEKETHEQKLLIEEKHKEITDSINYAERIQRSFLATQSHLDGNIGTNSNYFIFFQPKDVVSGDFYWSSTLLNGNFALATADSTGHGVPGAIMSLLNITSLEKAIETETSPDKILNLTRTIIIERLKKDGSADGGKDGMDCSVCVYDFKNKKLFVAAAHNPVWIVRRPVTEALEASVIEIKPDKMPVGKHDRQDIPFTLHEIDLQEGDVIYTLTDGFPDQFGGEKGKKYMSKNLRELLAANAHLPMPEQKELLQKTFSDWKGSLEQIDDVTVLGIRI